MSATTRALMYKFIMTFVVSVITLSLFDGNSWSMVFLYALIATVGNYLIGDLMILPTMGNFVASVGDGLMAAAIAYLLTLVFDGFRSTFSTLLALAALVAIGEYFFHGYLKNAEKVAP